MTFDCLTCVKWEGMCAACVYSPRSSQTHAFGAKLASSDPFEGSGGGVVVAVASDGD